MTVTTTIPGQRKVLRRGTSNTNARGSAESRRRRRRHLEAEHAVDGLLPCFRCGVPLPTDEVANELGIPMDERFEVDRIVPGCQGGRYVLGNIRPICPPCNKETGNAVRDGLIA